MAERTKDVPQRGTYGHLRCGTCGYPHEEHPEECPRHAYRPAWAAWLKANPSPHSTDRAVSLALREPAGSAVRVYAETLVANWRGRARLAGVPVELCGEDETQAQRPNSLANGAAH